MRILEIHCNNFSYKPRKKAIRDAPDLSEEQKKRVSLDNTLAVMMSFEKGDDKSIIPQLLEQVKKNFEEVKANSIILYPYAHLSSNLLEPSASQKLLKEAFNVFKKNFKEVHAAPFGWYKEFSLSCKGHPLSELSKTFAPLHEEKEEEEKGAEDGVLEEVLVIDESGIMKRENVKDEKLKKAIASELGEISESKEFEKPPHITFMKSLEISDHETKISDAGNLRYYPRGAFIVELLRELSWDVIVNELGAYPSNTPFIINPNSPPVKKMMGKFPERLYKVLPGKKEKEQEFRLRPACDYGTFSMLSDATISYKDLPLALYEFDYIWRYEQRGELLGMYRVRAAMMPNFHTLCADLEQAFEEFQKQIDKFAIRMYKYLGLEPSAIVLNCKRDFFEAHKDVFKKWAKELKIPIIVKLFLKMKTYKIAWVDVLAFDNFGRPMEIDTVQLDTESAKWWDMTYTAKDGTRKYPLIIHTGIGIERTIAGLLEHAAGMEKGPTLPVWLSPIQARIIPLEDAANYGEELLEKLSKNEVRADIDDRNISLNKKIRDAGRSWIPYVVVVGKREEKEKSMSVTVRASGERKMMKLEELIEEIHSKRIMGGRKMPFKPMPFASHLSRRPIFVG